MTKLAKQTPIQKLFENEGTNHQLISAYIKGMIYAGTDVLTDVSITGEMTEEGQTFTVKVEHGQFTLEGAINSKMELANIYVPNKSFGTDRFLNRVALRLESVLVSEIETQVFKALSVNM